MSISARTSAGHLTDERIETRRALITAGVSAEESGFWCAAWEAEAERQGIQADSQYFWDAGRGWIDAQRAMLVRPGPGRLDRGNQQPGRPVFSVVRS